nr:immunoglobulin heavy chain junction region [Macaca mulatta]
CAREEDDNWYFDLW